MADRPRIDFLTFNFSGISEGETRSRTPIECSDRSLRGDRPTRNIAGCFNPNFICVSRKKRPRDARGMRWGPGVTIHRVNLPQYTYVEHYIGAVRSWQVNNYNWGNSRRGRSLAEWKTPASKAHVDDLRAWSPCSLGCVFRTGYSSAEDGTYRDDTIRYIEFSVFKDEHENVLRVENSNQMGFCIDQHIVGGDNRTGNYHDKPLLKVPQYGILGNDGLTFKSVGIACEDPRIWKLNNHSIGILTNWSWNIDRSNANGEDYRLGPEEMANFLKILGTNSLPVNRGGVSYFSDPSSDRAKCARRQIADTGEEAGITTYENWSLNDLRGGVNKGPLPVWSKIPFDFAAEGNRSIDAVLDLFYAKWQSDDHSMWVRDFELLCSSFYDYGKGKGDDVARGGCHPSDKNWAILPRALDDRIDILRGVIAYGSRPNKIYRHTFNRNAPDDEIMNVSCELVALRSQADHKRTVSTILDETFAWLDTCRRQEDCYNDDSARLISGPNDPKEWRHGVLSDSNNAWKQRFNVGVDNNPLKSAADMLRRRLGGDKMFDVISVGGPMCNIINHSNGDEKLGIAHIKVYGGNFFDNGNLSEALFPTLKHFYSHILGLRREAINENGREGWNNRIPDRGYIGTRPGGSHSHNNILGVDHGDIKSYIYGTSYMNMVFKYDYKSMVIKQISPPFFMNSYGASSSKRDTWLQFTSQIINCGEGNKYCIPYGEEDGMAKMVFIPKDVLHDFLNGGNNVYPTNDHGRANYPPLEGDQIHDDWKNWINDVRILTPVGFESLDIITGRTGPRTGPESRREGRNGFSDQLVRNSNHFLTCYGPGDGGDLHVPVDPPAPPPFFAPLPLPPPPLPPPLPPRERLGLLNILPEEYQGTYNSPDFGPITLRGEDGDYPRPNPIGRGHLFGFRWSWESLTLTGDFTNQRQHFTDGKFSFTFDGRGRFQGSGRGGLWNGNWNGEGGPRVVPERALPHLPTNCTGTYLATHGEVELNRGEGVFTPTEGGGGGQMAYDRIQQDRGGTVTIYGRYINTALNKEGQFKFNINCGRHSFTGTWILPGIGRGDWTSTGFRPTERVPEFRPTPGRSLSPPFRGTYHTGYGRVRLESRSGFFTPKEIPGGEEGMMEFHEIEYDHTDGSVKIIGEYRNTYTQTNGTFQFTIDYRGEFIVGFPFQSFFSINGRRGKWGGRRIRAGGEKIEVQKVVIKNPQTKQPKQPKQKKMNKKIFKLPPGSRVDKSSEAHTYRDPPSLDIGRLLQKELKLHKEFAFFGLPNTDWLYIMYISKYVDQPKKAEEEARKDWMEGVKRDYTFAEFHLWISTKYNLPPPWYGTEYAIDFEDVSINKDSVGKKNKHATLKKKFSPERMAKIIFNPDKAEQDGILEQALTEGGNKMKKKKKKRSTKRNKKRQNSKKKHRKTAKSKK